MGSSPVAARSRGAHPPSELSATNVELSICVYELNGAYWRKIAEMMTRHKTPVVIRNPHRCSAGSCHKASLQPTCASEVYRVMLHCSCMIDIVYLLPACCLFGDRMDYAHIVGMFPLSVPGRRTWSPEILYVPRGCGRVYSVKRGFFFRLP